MLKIYLFSNFTLRPLKREDTDKCTLTTTYQLYHHSRFKDNELQVEHNKIETKRKTK